MAMVTASATQDITPHGMSVSEVAGSTEGYSEGMTVLVGQDLYPRPHILPPRKQ